jgi:CelD/BcsL family acetyltransferase involved in cellulose biosynthesis
MASAAQKNGALSVTFAAPDALLASSFARSWDDLARRSGEPNCFLERWFLVPSLRHLEFPASLRIAIVYDETGMLIGLLPLHMSDTYGRLRIAHVRNWVHHNSFLATPLVRAGYEGAFWDALLDALDSESWAGGLLHLSHLVEDGEIYAALVRATKARGRACDIVHRSERALLERGLDARTYYETTVRAKKRKEIRRLQSRLAELGTITTETLTTPDTADTWIADFLLLENAGWKGENGSSLGSAADTRGFFTDLVHEGLAAGRIEIMRLSLDGTPLAMLINFMAMPGSFQFKIAYDETFARFSPGVLIELENYAIMSRDGFGWMDSCAAEDHPMIDSLWSGRRSIVWIAAPLGGIKHNILFKGVRWAENGWAAIKWLRSRKGRSANDNAVCDQD